MVDGKVKEEGAGNATEEVVAAGNAIAEVALVTTELADVTLVNEAEVALDDFSSSFSKIDKRFFARDSSFMRSLSSAAMLEIMVLRGTRSSSKSVDKIKKSR